VLGGVAVRRELTIETLEDLQLAVGALLDRVEPDGEVTVVFSVTDEGVEAKVGPLRLDRELEREDGEELTLSRVLWAVVDDVQVEGDWVRLTKKVAPVG
jgi:hypothetical protein